MSRPDVICFGEILWDVFEAGPRVAGEPIARVFRRELGGAPANVAVGLARLGVGSAVVGGVGRDAFGEALAVRLRAEGVASSLLVQLPERTGLAFVRRDARGEPSFLFYRHQTADMSVRASHLRPAMARARWVLFGTSTLVHPGLAKATHALARLARAQRASIVVDLNVRAHLWKEPAQMRRAIARLARHADLIKGSRPDLAALGGGRFLARAPHATWVITDGPGEAIARGAHGETRAPARPARCVDATGAGDAFLAGLLAVLVRRDARPGTPAWRDPQVFGDALRVGHILGAKAVSRVGAAGGLTGLQAARRIVHRGAP